MQDSDCEYIGADHWGIFPSTDVDGCIDQLMNIVEAIQTNQLQSKHLGRNANILIERTKKGMQAECLLQRLIAKIQSRQSLEDEITNLIVRDGSHLEAQYESFTAEAILNIILPVSFGDFYPVIRNLWAEIEQQYVNVLGSPDINGTSNFDALIDWVYKMVSCESYELLINWLKHKNPKIRNSAAWHLRHWMSPMLADQLCDVLLMGKDDPAAHEHSFFIFWRLERLMDPENLPVLEGLLGTGYDKEREFPCNPPPSMPKRNMLRTTIEACKTGQIVQP
jgi:hypothetical protein